ncbi:ANR family transcriptional regulator [Serratia bockelmannii]|uniref:ANR family transcriptional regulator n=1 Tax=Serratia bockelmannii TaxID=2703793 RepID=UPI0023616998|nr:ANR family transcriptional regulator [Serratia bockelmannii]
MTFETPTRGEAFTQACRLAADLEKRGNYAAAQARWEEGMALAMTHIDRHWCDARASLCKRRANGGNTEVDSIWLRALRD